MPAADASEAEDLGSVETNDSNTSPLGAIVSVWYLWIGTAAFAVFTYLAFTRPGLDPSATDQILFSFLTVLLFLAGVYLAYYRYTG